MKFAYLIEPPFNYLTADGVATGCDVELAKYVISKIGEEKFDPIETDFSSLLPGLANCDWRMTTGLFATQERKAIASFSRPIWALPDGFLVRAGNPLKLSGYQSIAANSDCILAVIRDQFQHRSAIEFGIPKNRIRLFATYLDAAQAVATKEVNAYASVGRAHAGFLKQNSETELGMVTVPSSEKKPAFGSFAFAKADKALVRKVDEILTQYIGSHDHRAMMAHFGFLDHEIDLLLT